MGGGYKKGGAEKVVSHAERGRWGTQSFEGTHFLAILKGGANSFLSFKGGGGGGGGKKLWTREFSIL